MKSTNMTLQLDNKYITHPHGVGEDVLVRVDKFLLPIDFVVIDMEEDDDAPLIVGRSFMKTTKDDDEGLMKIKVQDEEICFNLFEAMKHSKDKGDCFRMDSTNKAIMDVTRQVHLST